MSLSRINSKAFRLRCSKPMVARRTRSMPQLIATASKCLPDGYSADVLRMSNVPGLAEQLGD